ncbi:hypothetical protein [Streptomyces sp. NPDC001020]
MSPSNPGRFIYNRVQIDAQTLRVGRERFALVYIDPFSVQEAAAQTGIPAGALNGNGHSNARLVGGGWAVPMGMGSVVIRTRQGAGLCIATRDRTAFLAALAQATSGRNWSPN